MTLNLHLAGFTTGRTMESVNSPFPFFHAKCRLVCFCNIPPFIVILYVLVSKLIVDLLAFGCWVGCFGLKDL